MDEILHEITPKNKARILRKIYKVASKKADVLAKIKGRRVAGKAVKPLFKTREHGRTMGVFGAYQNPINLPTIFTDLPSARRVPCVPHRVKLDNDRWVFTKSNSDNRPALPTQGINVYNADIRDAFAPGSVSFFFGKNRKQVFAIDRKTHKIMPVATTWSMPDTISESEWDALLGEAADEVLQGEELL
jgi:hypothetical protein